MSTTPAANIDLDPLDRPVWGREAIAQVVGRTVAATTYLLEAGELPAEKVGRMWVTTRRKLQERISGIGPAPARKPAPAKRRGDRKHRIGNSPRGRDAGEITAE